MKKYSTLGELLRDYRMLHNITQADLAANLNVDIRTMIRWENNDTLIKTDKEEELVEETFIPYQVIRNLNASVAIPVYYDFRLRKYSLSKLSKELPDASWFRSNLHHDSHRSRPIASAKDVAFITRYINFFYAPMTSLPGELILEAARRLPELNQILFDTSGFYAGHSIVFPIKKEVYKKIRNREMSEMELNISCLTSKNNKEETIFYSYNLTADCNENIYYILCPTFCYFQPLKAEEYLFAGYAGRADGFSLLEQIGLKQVWEDDKIKFVHGLETKARFFEGDFADFLSG